MKITGNVLRDTMSNFVLACAVVLCGWSASYGEEFRQPEPLEPEVAEASAEGVESMAGIRIPPDWDIQLYAAEPDLANVVAFEIDNRGRVYVCETFRQNQGVTDNRAHDDEWVKADLAAQRYRFLRAEEVDAIYEYLKQR